MKRIGEDEPRAVLATTILSFSLSSILTGLVFWTMGQCRLGSLIGFFPRHILIGCIGGIGFFLVVTVCFKRPFVFNILRSNNNAQGLEISANVDGNISYNLETLRKLASPQTVLLWTLPLTLSFGLLLMKRWVKYSLVDAVFFIGIFATFYIVALARCGLDLTRRRATGWIFDAPQSGVPWYHFYTLYDFQIVDWSALARTFPTMLALTFFGILHVPINVPALGLSVGEDSVDVDRELRAHGLSNTLSGLCGSIQNYLVYANVRTCVFLESILL